MSFDLPLIGGLPFLGPIANKIDENARMAAQALEDQARLVASMPKTLQAANDAITAFSETLTVLNDNVQRLNRVTEPMQVLNDNVQRLNRVTEPMLAPLERLAPRLEQVARLLDELPDLRAVPSMLTQMTRDTIPAFTSAVQSQEQVARSVDTLVAILDEALGRLAELPGAGFISRALGMTAASARASATSQHTSQHAGADSAPRPSRRATRPSRTPGTTTTTTTTTTPATPETPRTTPETSVTTPETSMTTPRTPARPRTPATPKTPRTPRTPRTPATPRTPKTP